MSIDLIRQFAEAVYADAFEHDCHAVMFAILNEPPHAPSRSTARCATIDEVIAAASRLEQSQHNVYYPLMLIHRNLMLPDGSRGKAADAAALLGLHVDIDLQSPAHPDANVPDIDTALSIIDAFELPPSIVVHTGHGIQGLWLFNEPWTFVNEDEQRQGKQLVRRHVATMMAIAHQVGGYRVDGTGDLARVLRMPGTTNRKVSDGQTLLPVTTSILRPAPAGDLTQLVRYNPDDIELMLVQLDESERTIDYGLVGPVTFNPEAHAPAIVEQICQRSPNFARLWNYDKAVALQDLSTSGYRFAMIGHLVRASCSDQAIVDAICAWYARHHPAYDKHLRRTQLIIHEIAKQRSPDSTSNNSTPPSPLDSPLDSPPELAVTDDAVSTPVEADDLQHNPRSDGPCGVMLVALESRRTPTKMRVRCAVYLDGRDTDAEIQLTDNANGLSRAMGELIAILGEHDRSPDKASLTALQAWLRKVQRGQSLDDWHKQLQRIVTTRDAASPQPEGPTVHVLAIAYIKDELGLAFVEQGNLLWSETLGRALNRREIMEFQPTALVNHVRTAVDFAHPTPGNPTKHLHHLQLQLKTVWSDLLGELCHELQATHLGPHSKAANHMRQLILQIWQKPVQWVKVDDANSRVGGIERCSLASHVRGLAAAGTRPRTWSRVIRSVDAYWRITPVHGEAPRVELAMRASLCQGAIERIILPAIEEQGDLTTLMRRYGLSDAANLDARVREGAPQTRLCVLAPDLVEQLLYGVDEADQSPPVTDPTPPSVTQGSGPRVANAPNEGGEHVG